MWSIKFVWCMLLVSGAFALPTSSKSENESDAQKPEAMITVDVIQMPADEKPTDNSKPSEMMAVDPKPIDVKPTEQTKPNEMPSSAPSSSANTFESIPLNVGPSRPQLLYDQRQDGKYNIRADLENFVILVVPSTGNSLLDLLKRSGQRPQQQNHHVKRVHHTKHHKKYHPSTGKTVEVKKVANRLDYLNQGEESPVTGEFIEGRTPYHVDIQSDEILQPAYAPGGVRSLADSGAVTIADLPLVNLDDNTASSSADAADSTIILSTVTGKQKEKSNNFPAMSNIESSPQHRLPKSIVIGYGNPLSNLNTVLLTPKTSNVNDQPQQQQLPNNDNTLINKNYNNYFSSRHSVQIVDRNVGTNENYNNYGIDSMANLINSPSTELFDLTDTKNSFNSLNVGNIDRLALAGDSTTKLKDADLANANWELTLIGAEEQCGPDRRRDSYGVCQFVPADYATT